MDRGQRERLRRNVLHGRELVDSAARLCAMNLYLHGIGGGETNITVDDSLRAHPGANYDLLLTNPPFGRKSSLTFVNSEGETERETLTVERPDFWATTSNKQLNFLQHVRALLRLPTGIFYAQGVKANPLTRADLDDFVACYHPDNRLRREESERFRRFSYPESIRSG